MEELKVKGIVLKSVDYKDSDKIVTIFSTEHGLIDARVRGVKKNKAKLTFAVQPFAFVEFILVKSGNYYSCINATSIDQFFDITLDFDNYVFMLACLEVCLKTVKANDSQPELFLLLLNAQKAVCYDKINGMYVFIKFMLEAMKILGYYFETQNCPVCGEKISGKEFLFSYDFNGVLCEKCAVQYNGLLISKGEYTILNLIDTLEIDKLANFKIMSRDDVISVITLLIKDFRLLTGYEIESIKMFL